MVHPDSSQDDPLQHRETPGSATGEGKVDVLPTIEFHDHLVEEPNEMASEGTQTRDQGGAFGVNGGSTWVSRKSPAMTLPPELPPKGQRFNVRQKWEGFVIEKNDETFLAWLTPIMGEGPDQIAEIYISKVETEDRALVKPGAVFYWTIGYARDESPTLRRDQILRFRRLPGWTDQELEKARARAERLESLFNGD